VVTAPQRRQAVRFLRERFGASERRACRVPGQQRSAQRQPPKKATEEEGRLVARMLELVRKHPRFGYRRIWALLRREGWRVNRKRVHRPWRQQGPKVPRK
jgi:putative transposase